MGQDAGEDAQDLEQGASKAAQAAQEEEPPGLQCRAGDGGCQQLKGAVKPPTAPFSLEEVHSSISSNTALGLN